MFANLPSTCLNHAEIYYTSNNSLSSYIVIYYTYNNGQDILDKQFRISNHLLRSCLNCDKTLLLYAYCDLWISCWVSRLVRIYRILFM